MTTRPRPTIRTIAEAAGVSVATVSYVLNNRDTAVGGVKITAATRERVLAAARAADYRPSRMARGIRRGKTDQVCLSVDHLDSPWSLALIDAVCRDARALGKTTLLLVDGDWQGFLAQQGADGAVILGDEVLTEADHHQLRRLAARGIALVVFEGEGAFTDDPEPDGFDVIRLRCGPGLDTAMDLLTSRHRRIGCLRRNEPGQPAIRYQSYCQGLQRAGIEFDPALVRDTHSNRDLAYRQALDLLERPDRPTAIFASNDLAAISTVWAAHRLGLSIPDDLEVIGVGNSPEGQSADPPLTSVGAESVFTDISGLLMRRLTAEVPPPGTVQYCDWSLYQRGTTR